MKKMLVKAGIAAAAALTAFALAACGGLGGSDPAKAGDVGTRGGEAAGTVDGNGAAGNAEGTQSGNSGEGEDGSKPAADAGGSAEAGGNEAGSAPAKQLPALVPFDDVFFAEDGTVYVGMPGTFPFLEVQGAGEASIYWLDIPGTVPVKRADYFAVYDGKLYFTEFIHPSDAAARKTPLYVAELDGSNPRVLVDDVAAEDSPVIIDGVLYYLSFEYDENQEVYTYDTENGGTVQASDAANCTSVLRSYDLATGATAAYDVCRTMAADFVGATEDWLYVSTLANGSEQEITILTRDFEEVRTIEVPGYAYGVDAAGHIVSHEWVATSLYRLYVSDSNGAVLETFDTTNWGTAFSMNRYAMYTDKQGATVVFDTIAMAEAKRVQPIDNWAKSMTYCYYNPETDAVYFLGTHGTIPGTYTGWGSGNDVSVFVIESDGQTKRILPYLDVLWCRTGAWDSPQGYVLQWCEIDFYSYEQLSQLSNEQLFHARNEDFWCHGFDFNHEMNDPELQAYYEKKTWPRELSNSWFTNAEFWNLALVEQIEAERNSPYAGRGYTLEYLDSLE